MDVPKDDELDVQAIKNFRRYLRIPSVHPDINYDDCLTFIKEQAEEIGLSWKVYEFVEKKPIIVLKWEGTDLSQPSILLNSHMDVVPVFPELWTHDPFGAEMDVEGNIYARGAQDMKSVGIQYLEAIRRLKLNGQKNKRTVYLSFVPDEEIGGADGMGTFVKKQEFKDLNVGFALDESSPSETEAFELNNGERIMWQIEFKITGTGGHGSLMLKDTPGEKLRNLLDKLMDYRQSQIDLLEDNPQLRIGDVTTVNVTMLQGGLEVNVIPPEFKASVDIRIALDVNLDFFKKQIDKWCEESGGGIEIKFIYKDERVEPTKLDDSNPYWIAMKKETDKLGLVLDCFIMAGGTDSQFIRQIGIPAISFSPINNTISRLHANDEYLNKDIFLKGIEIYEKIISGVANV